MHPKCYSLSHGTLFVAFRTHRRRIQLTTRSDIILQRGKITKLQGGKKWRQKTSLRYQNPQKTDYGKRCLTSTRYVQYYDMQNSRLSAWDKLVKLNVLIGTAVAVASGFQAMHPLAGVGGALFMVVWTAIDYVLAFGSRAALSHAISLECSVIEKEYEELWMLVRLVPNWRGRKSGQDQAVVDESLRLLLS